MVNLNGNRSKRAISLHMDGPKQGATLWAHYLVVAQGLWEKYQAACKRVGTAAEHGFTLDAKWNYVTDMFGHPAVQEEW
jgi:hypothetical protein